MTHSMSLWHTSFVKIKEGTKTIEIRLYDEKRSKISIGDTIVFVDTSTGNKAECLVLELYRYSTFSELYSHHDKISIGYDKNEIADPNDMLAYYSNENISKYGVVGIKIKTI